MGIARLMNGAAVPFEKWIWWAKRSEVQTTVYFVLR